MISEVDLALLEQWFSCKRRLANVQRMKRVFNDPVNLMFVEHRIHGYMKFCEDQISDKSLLKKRKRHKTKKSKDILYRNPVETYYRNIYMVMTFTIRSVSSYWNLWYKKEE
jgi:hypothetical protein